MSFIRPLLDLSAFIQLPKQDRRIVFYSEGKANWSHLEPVLQSFLRLSEIPVCYFTSQIDDPGLALKHPRLRGFLLDEGWLRNWFFANVETDLCVMTMPDLHQYQIKRSKHPVHYVYIHHALVSSHMVYRPGAFDHFDTIFCAGPHHLKEIRALEAQGQLPAKNLVEHGYGRLDAILAQAATHSSKAQDNHILLAPSWGTQGLIETYGEAIISQLLAAEFALTLRPHPQTLKFSKKVLNKIIQKHQNNPLFTLETNVVSQDSLHRSALMISDWSGAALDYAFGLEKPVLFVDIPRKVNNPDYEKLGIIPFEVEIRDKIGEIISVNKLDEISSTAEKMIRQSSWKDRLRDLRSAHTFNVGTSGEVGARTLIELLS